MLYIRKSSGEKQRFNLHKFRRSLLKAGATDKNIDTIIRRLKKEKPKSTVRIHAIATEMLQEINPPVADRYNLKRALMQLGPHGYPFEKFVAHLFTLEGYMTQTNQVIPGGCVNHEIDVSSKQEKDLVPSAFSSQT